MTVTASCAVCARLFRAKGRDARLCSGSAPARSGKGEHVTDIPACVHPDLRPCPRRRGGAVRSTDRAAGTARCRSCPASPPEAGFHAERGRFVAARHQPSEQSTNGLDGRRPPTSAQGRRAGASPPGASPTGARSSAGCTSAITRAATAAVGSPGATAGRGATRKPSSGPRSSTPTGALSRVRSVTGERGSAPARPAADRPRALACSSLSAASERNISASTEPR
jgi:hypothetical protein